ncbi:MAG: glycosyltransferase [Synechococcus sp. ELA057]
MHSGPRLLFLFEDLDISGTHHVALNLVERASSNGYHCRMLICMNDRIGDSSHDERFILPPRILGQSEALLSKFLKFLVLLWTAPKLARHTDLLIATCPASSLIGAWASLLSRKPLLGWVHYDVRGRQREVAGMGRGWIVDILQNWLYYLFMPRLESLIFVSETARVSMRKAAGRKVSSQRWIVLPNLYQRSLLQAKSSSLDRLLDLKATGKPIVLFIGRLAFQKRWIHAIQAAEALDDMGVVANWVFIGDGPDRHSFLSALQGSPLAQHLHWLGLDPNPLPVFKHVDALVLTSLYEAWPTVILEAFDQRLPVVSYDCPSGPREMLGNQKRGWLTEENPQRIAVALAEIFGPNGADIAKQRSQAAQEYLRQFDPEIAFSQWDKTFRKILRRHHRI